MDDTFLNKKKLIRFSVNMVCNFDGFQYYNILNATFFYIKCKMPMHVEKSKISISKPFNIECSL